MEGDPVRYFLKKVTLKFILNKKHILTQYLGMHTA